VTISEKPQNERKEKGGGCRSVTTSELSEKRLSSDGEEATAS